MIFTHKSDKSKVYFPLSCSVSGPFTLKLVSKLTGKEFVFENLEGTVNVNNIVFEIDLSDIPEGEFEASLNCEIRTMMQVGERNVDSNIYYDKSIKNISYEID